MPMRAALRSSCNVLMRPAWPIDATVSSACRVTVLAWDALVDTPMPAPTTRATSGTARAAATLARIGMRRPNCLLRSSRGRAATPRALRCPNRPGPTVRADLEPLRKAFFYYRWVVVIQGDFSHRGERAHPRLVVLAGDGIGRDVHLRLVGLALHGPRLAGH